LVSSSKQSTNGDGKTTTTIDDKVKQAEILDLNVLNEVLNKSLDLTLRFIFFNLKLSKQLFWIKFLIAL
jgi:hypothetical protein